MSKAAEKELSELHGLVAQVLSAQIGDKITITDETGEEREIYGAAPAVIAQAVKFLKDNDITASVEEDENLSELDDLLKKKRRKRAMRGNVVQLGDHDDGSVAHGNR